LANEKDIHPKVWKLESEIFVADNAPRDAEKIKIWLTKIKLSQNNAIYEFISVSCSNSVSG
jgi:hypothetical protein